MRITERSYLHAMLASVATVTLLGACATKHEPREGAAVNPVQQKAFETGIEAYVYGYPLVTMEMTRRVTTNVAAPEQRRAPMGQIANAREYATPAFRDVSAANADTLYSTAWIDLSKEPYVLTLPKEDGRYYLFPVLSAWTNVIAAPGTRTTGTKEQKYAITGPGWKGQLPAGVQQIKSPTNLVWLIGRTYCTGTREDYEAVHTIQDHYSLLPLSAYGKPYTPPHGQVDPNIDMKTAVREQVNSMSAAEYFKLLAALMKDNPPAPADSKMVAKLKTIGIVPGQDFDMAKLDSNVAKGLELAPKAGWEKIIGHEKAGGRVVNSWVVTIQTGEYRTDYVQRAFVTSIGVGANRPQDTVYPFTLKDSQGERLTGANQYVMRFPKGQTPPAKGFWSLTMYDADYFFIENPLKRYTLSPRNALKYNEDGSFVLYIQADDPGGDKESNWLPAPKGDFNLMLRLYWNSESSPTIVNGSWDPPPVVRVR